MAVTSLWAVKNSLADVVNYAQNPEKTECPDLAQVLRYAGNDCKTEHRYFVTGVGCLAETAGEQMMNTKRRFGKSGGYVAYHGYQSFKPGELTPAQAHEIGIEFAKRLWGERYEVLVATHLNTDCCHNHFVVNSVSFVDGKKLVVKKGTYLELRRVSDAIPALASAVQSFSALDQPSRPMVSSARCVASALDTGM
ncbi:MAG: relaxase/mobilization nuclease domain-containing protein [Oscillospiraceae bacterium]